MKLNKAEKSLIDELVAHYEKNQGKLRCFLLDQVQPVLTSPANDLVACVHSFKSRLKDPQHLRRKLTEKMLETKVGKRKFQINRQNLFWKINDLVGIRILHLHTRQMQVIDKALREILADARFNIIEGPYARTWDDETKTFFKEIGIKTKQSGPSMYTSVHYVIDSNSRTRYTAEIQVRTLAEELWGEVSHVIDYPAPCTSLACREQIRVLARLTSGCTRLVDSIFRTFEEHKSKSN